MKSACLFYTIQASGYFHRSGLHAVLSSKSSHWWVLSNQMHLMGLRQTNVAGGAKADNGSVKPTWQTGQGTDIDGE